MDDMHKDLEWNGSLFINFVNMNSADRKMVRSWRNHAEIRKWMYTDHEITDAEHESFIVRLKDDERNYYWLVKDDNGIGLGVISLNKVDRQNSNAYLGIYTAPVEFAPVTGSRLISGIKHLAFRVLKLHTLKLEVIDENARAKKFYLKAGFQEEGLLREFVRKDNHWLNVKILGLINSEED